MFQTNPALKLIAAGSDVVTGNAVGGLIGALGVLLGQESERERLAKTVRLLAGAGWDAAAKAKRPDASLTLPDKALTCDYIAHCLASASVASVQGLVEFIDPQAWPVGERLVAAARAGWRGSFARS
jgi:hypothetical protein